MQPDLFSEPKAKPSVTADLHILTWNMQRAGPARVAKQVSWIAEAGCDVLCLTEVPSGDSGDIVVRELSGLGYDCIRTFCPPRSAGALLATLRPMKALPIPEFFPEPWRISLGIIEAFAGSSLLVASIYAPPIGRFRDNTSERHAFHDALQRLLGAVSLEQAGGHILFGGDLNVHPSEQTPWIRGAVKSDFELLDNLRTLGLQSVHKRFENKWPLTWHGATGEEYTFDYILCSPTLLNRCVGGHCHSEVSAQGLSDHRPFTATFKMSTS